MSFSLENLTLGISEKHTFSKQFLLFHGSTAIAIFRKRQNLHFKLYQASV